jgi:hypothetical protein
MSVLNNKLSNVLINGTKRFAFVVALLLTVGVGSSFAAPADDSNDAIIATFHKDFRTADVMQVEAKKEYTKLTFKMNGVIMFAYYNENGDLMAVVRNILSTQLPIRLLMNLKEKQTDELWISDLFEIDQNGQTTYYATLENSENKVTLRSADATSWQTYQKK